MRESLMIDRAPVSGHFQALKAMGVSQETLEKVLGMTKTELEMKDAWIPFRDNVKMIEKGIELIGPQVPLKLGSLVRLENMGACGFIFKNCADFDELIHQFLRYQKLLYAVSEFRLTRTPHTVMVSHAVNNPCYQQYGRLLVELAFSAIMAVIKALFGKNIKVRELRFAHSKPDYVNAYQDIFNAPLQFNCKTDMIILDREQLKKSIPDSHHYIKDTLMQHANQLLSKVESNAQFKDEVGKLILLNLHKGSVDIEMISDKMNMSRWTLTRKLKKEGVTFKHLLNRLRMKTAMIYLENPELSITDIAFLLGYSEPGVFSRSFKGWVGENPSEYKLKKSKKADPFTPKTLCLSITRLL